SWFVPLSHVRLRHSPSGQPTSDSHTRPTLGPALHVPLPHLGHASKCGPRSCPWQLGSFSRQPSRQSGSCAESVSWSCSAVTSRPCFPPLQSMLPVPGPVCVKHTAPKLGTGTGGMVTVPTCTPDVWSKSKPVTLKSISPVPIGSVVTASRVVM